MYKNLKILFITVFILYVNCLKVKRTTKNDYVGINIPNNCGKEYDGYYGSSTSCECGLHKKNTLLSAFKNGKPKCGGISLLKALDEYTLSRSGSKLNLGLKGNCRNLKIYIWNVQQGNVGVWVDQTKNRISALKIVPNDVDVSGIDVIKWSGQLIRVDILCSNSKFNFNILLKVVGDIEYPFDLTKLFTPPTTMSPTTTSTSTTTSSTLSSHSSSAQITTKTRPVTLITTSTKKTPRSTTTATTTTTPHSTTTTTKSMSSNKKPLTTQDSLTSTSVATKITVSPTDDRTTKNAIKDGSSGADGKNLEIILAIVIVATIAVLLVVIIMIVCVCRRRKKKRANQSEKNIAMKSPCGVQEVGSYPSLESKSSGVDDTYLVPVDTVKYVKDKNKNIYLNSVEQGKRNSRDLNNPIYRTIDYADVRDITLPPTNQSTQNNNTYTGLTRERLESAISTNSTHGLLRQDDYAPLNNTYSGLIQSPQDNYAPLNTLPNNSYSALNTVPVNYAAVDNVPNDNLYTDLTRDRHDTILSTTGSTCGLINESTETYTPLDDEPVNNSYATLDSIQENYEAIPERNKSTRPGDAACTNEPIYKVIDYEQAENVYQGIVNANFHTDYSALNNDQMNVDTIYHELES